MVPSSNSDTEERKSKQRIVGALVLIALAVIIIPMILDFRKDYDRVIKGSNIPPKPDDFHVEVVPLTPPGQINLPTIQDTDEALSDTPPSEPVLAPEPETEAQKAPPPPAAVKESDAQPANTTIESRPVKEEPEEVPDEVSSPADAGWIVQLGSFSSQENAEHLRDRLQDKGYKAFVDAVTIEGKLVQRVRIGPVEEKAGAEAIRDKLATEMKLNAIVLTNK